MNDINVGTCSVCGEFPMWANHKCPPLWYCIQKEDYGNNVLPPSDFMFDEGKVIYAKDHKEAALKFAEAYQARANWYPDEMDVLVMDSEGTKIYFYPVYQQPVPEYSTIWQEPSTFDAKKEEQIIDDKELKR